MTTLSKVEAIARIKRVEVQHKEDAEVSHSESMAVLLEFLGAQGHKDLVDAYRSANAHFWHK